jgi:uncharacterized protein YndB with AHSA1/START domain
LVVERTYEAPPARVFAAWATAAARRRWAVPGEGWEIAEDEDDFRVGGREVSRFGPPGDPAFVAVTNYLDIVPERRIVMAGTMARGEQRISAAMGTVELAAAGGGTRLVYTEQAAFLDGLDTRSDHEQRWGKILDKLGVELQRGRV